MTQEELKVQDTTLDFFRDALYVAEDDFLRGLSLDMQEKLLTRTLEPLAVKRAIAKLWDFAVGDSNPPVFVRLKKNETYYRSDTHKICMGREQRYLLGVIHEVAHAVHHVVQGGFIISHSYDFQNFYVTLVTEYCGSKVGRALEQKLSEMRAKVLAGIEGAPARLMPLP